MKKLIVFLLGRHMKDRQPGWQEAQPDYSTGYTL
jgi:hypothetical protein